MREVLRGARSLGCQAAPGRCILLRHREVLTRVRFFQGEPMKLVDLVLIVLIACALVFLLWELWEIWVQVGHAGHEAK